MSMNLKKVRLCVLGLTECTDPDFFTVILAEEGGTWKLPITVGRHEAQAILIQLERVMTPRPMTHDMVSSILRSFSIDISEVLIYDVSEGIFRSVIVCKKGTFETHVDSRTSDAVAMALKFRAPIYIYEHILHDAGINLPVEFAKAKRTPSLEDLTTDELERKLQESIQVEDYETAAQLRDMLRSRKDA